MSEPNPHGRRGSSYGPPSGGYAARDAARLVFNVSGDFEAATDTLYDPALGEDRSVRLSAVLGWMRACVDDPEGPPHRQPSARLARHLGGGNAR